jgi:hypothetical protein
MSRIQDTGEAAISKNATMRSKKFFPDLQNSAVTDMPRLGGFGDNH